MTLTLARAACCGPSRPGQLTVDGAAPCYALENDALKIPAGRYRIAITFSQRAFDGQLWTPDPMHRLPLVCDVPGGRKGIRMHAANEYYQLEGCIAVGETWNGVWLGRSQRTFAPIFARLLEAAGRHEDNWIEVHDEVTA